MDKIQQIERWSRYHAIGMILALVTFINVDRLWVLPVISFISFGYLVITKRDLLVTENLKMSRANLITLGRHDLLMILVLVSIYLEMSMIGISASLIACLDLLDGYYARKDKNTTILGEYLDKEVDALFVLMMCAMIYHFQLLPIWILMVGILRFIYVLILPWIKSPQDKEYKFKFGRVIAVILMIGLIGSFFIRYAFYEYVMIAVSVLVLISFLHAMFYWFSKSMTSR